MTNEDLKNLKARLKNQKPPKPDKYKSQLRPCKYCGAEIACNKCPQCGGVQKRPTIWFAILGLPLLILGVTMIYFRNYIPGLVLTAIGVVSVCKPFSKE
jgi:hypothetical protein